VAMFIGKTPFSPKLPEIHTLSPSPEGGPRERTEQKWEGRPDPNLKRLTKARQDRHEYLPKGVPLSERLSVQLREEPAEGKGGKPRSEEKRVAEGISQYRK